MIKNLARFDKEKKSYKLIITSSFDKETVVKINGYKICEYDLSYMDSNDYEHYNHIAIYKVDGDTTIPNWGETKQKPQPRFIIHLICDNGRFSIGYYEEHEIFENLAADLLESYHTPYDKSLVLNAMADYLSYEHDIINKSEDCEYELGLMIRNEVSYFNLTNTAKSALDPNCIQ